VVLVTEVAAGALALALCDGKHEAAGQPGHDQPGARDDGHDPDGQHGGQGRAVAVAT
jgi:hypothetical protein